MKKQEEWQPMEFPNGWRAVAGNVQDGRVWQTAAECAAYCDGMAQGWRDATGESALGPLATLFRRQERHG